MAYIVTLGIVFPPGFIINVILFWRIFKSDVLRSLNANKTLKEKKPIEKEIPVEQEKPVEKED